jgi:xanthine dehydrogenase accessory factor
MDEIILLKIYESLRKTETVAMAVITSENGSAPRGSGSIMAIWKDGKTLGSIGGGKVEYLVTDKAIECIKNREDFNFEYKLNEQGGLGMKCGGEVKGYIRVFYPKPKLLIAGAGHISEKLNKLAKVLDFYTVVIDDRKEYANKERFQEADEIIVGDIGKAVEEYNIDDNTYVVIVTSGYDQDKNALKSSVLKEAAYVGMIGSTMKIKSVMKELKDAGIPEEKLKKVYAPMGIDIASNLPEEIALGIFSEILLVKNKGNLKHRRDLKKVWD